MHIIVYGNAVDGFTFRGPFADANEAIEYADKYDDKRDTWCIAEIESPAE